MAIIVQKVVDSLYSEGIKVMSDATYDKKYGTSSTNASFRKKYKIKGESRKIKKKAISVKGTAIAVPMNILIQPKFNGAQINIIDGVIYGKADTKGYAKRVPRDRAIYKVVDLSKDVTGEIVALCDDNEDQASLSAALLNTKVPIKPGSFVILPFDEVYDVDMKQICEDNTVTVDGNVIDCDGMALVDINTEKVKAFYKFKHEVIVELTDTNIEELTSKQVSKLGSPVKYKGKVYNKASVIKKTRNEVLEGAGKYTAEIVGRSKIVVRRKL